MEYGNDTLVKSSMLTSPNGDVLYSVMYFIMCQIRYQYTRNMMYDIIN